jgi:hypothetical protein
MQDLYERLVELLGKTDEDQAFHNFLKHLGCAADFDCETQLWRECSFSELGFRIIFCKPSRCCSIIFFHIGEGSAEAGMKLYRGGFPAGITPGDRRDEIATKLGMNPTRTDCERGLYDTYAVNDSPLSFLFDPVTEDLRSMMLTIPDEEPSELEMAEQLAHFPPF